MRKIQLFCILLIFVSGCTTQRISFPHLSKADNDTLNNFDAKISQITSEFTPQQVKEILGEPDQIDAEDELSIKDQESVWTYEHPIIGSARFIIIFRDGQVDLLTIASRDVFGKSHYLRRDEFLAPD
tara:strand:+ start:1892 stop:2272 length:381 start_codon:yes stop_codon:yes gene_type:complete